MLQISEIVRKTEEMFDLFNEHFYEGELNHPAITVSPDGGRGAYGWCSINEIWNASGEKYREINLCAEYLDRPIFELAATLLHEMAHLYNLVHGIQNVTTKLNISVISSLDHQHLFYLSHKSTIHPVLAPLQHKEFFSIVLS